MTDPAWLRLGFWKDEFFAWPSLPAHATATKQTILDFETLSSYLIWLLFITPAAFKHWQIMYLFLKFSLSIFSIVVIVSFSYPDRVYFYSDWILDQDQEVKKSSELKIWNYIGLYVCPK